MEWLLAALEFEVPTEFATKLIGTSNSPHENPSSSAASGAGVGRSVHDKSVMGKFASKVSSCARFSATSIQNSLRCKIINATK